MKLFLDTMLWLHYQPVDDLDLTKLVSAKTPLTIVVPRITTRELDKHKNSHRSTKIKDRARRWLKQFTALPADNPLKNGVELELYLTAPKVDWSTLGLDPTVNDDVLLATILHYRQSNPQEEVRFYTADATPSLMAANLGIPVFEFPEEWKLDEDPDPAAKELRELKAELERNKRARPRLTCGLLAGGKMATNVIISLSNPKPFPETELQEHLAKIREEFPVKRPARYLTTQERVIGQMFAPDRKEFDRYNAEAAAYPARVTAYWRECHTRLVLDQLATRVRCQIRNDGEVPADDVDLELNFPKWCLVMESLQREPEAPREPTPPKSHMDIRVLDRPFFAEPFIPVQSEPEPFSILSSKTGFVMKKHFERIKHGHTLEVNVFLITFADLAHAKSLALKGRITAANLREPVEVLLNVQIQKPAEGQA